MKKSKFTKIASLICIPLLSLLAATTHAEPRATASGDSKPAEKPIIIPPHKPVGRIYDHATGITYESHNPLLDQYIGKRVAVRGKFQHGKVSKIGNVTIQNKLGHDFEALRALDGKQVECIGVLVKSVVEHGKPVQAVAGTHYNLEQNGPIRPLAEAKPE